MRKKDRHPGTDPREPKAFWSSAVLAFVSLGAWRIGITIERYADDADSWLALPGWGSAILWLSVLLLPGILLGRLVAIRTGVVVVRPIFLGAMTGILITTLLWLIYLGQADLAALFMGAILGLIPAAFYAFLFALGAKPVVTRNRDTPPLPEAELR